MSETTNRATQDRHEATPAPELTLRDMLAASVVSSIWTRFRLDGTSVHYDNWREGVAIEAYRLADEMLDVRSRKQQGNSQ